MTATANQNPEQIARDRIDQMLMGAGWLVQDKSKVNLSAGLSIVVGEYLNCPNSKKFYLKETWSEENPDGRWRKYSYDEIIDNIEAGLESFRVIQKE
ncbi:hypothetical protein QYS49_07680 [Marivirga salinae]|uniref:Uncharacterized protein n=1 Tax=Marivirga salinarum TaxID=3059078 RepID=A0AA49JBX9_9BACT|nr:hypothetical protein [Marivirga sp. BDSF4-3]WKK77092.2 hypothetical protein QYS49_07680 [Marivirga sp. BDSF4-3]